MNILYISMFSHIGGGEISLLTLINNLDRSKFTPYVVCYEYGPFIRRLQENKINFVIIRRTSCLANFTLVVRLASFIKKNAINLIHVNGLDIRAAAAAALAGVPMVGHLRVIYPFSWVDRLSGRLARRVIMVSQAVRKHFCIKSAALYQKGIVIPNAVDLSAGLVPVDLRQEYHLAADSLLIGIVGRFDAFKGHDVFIEAAACLKQRGVIAKFILIGETVVSKQPQIEYLADVRRLIEQRGLTDDVIFTGFRPDVLNVIAGLNMLIVPTQKDCTRSYIRTEGFGRVAVEAMAVGVPVIVSRAGGLPEIVEDGVSGLVVEPADARGFADAALSLLEDPGKREAIVANARQRFEALYTAPVHARAVEKIYESIK